MTGARTIGLKLFLGWLCGLFLAVLAFSQAAASIGLAIDSFRPLGAGFFSWRSGQMRLAISVYEPGKKVDSERLIDTGRATLKLAPLNPRSLWLVGKGLEIEGNMADARKAMRQSDRLSRRDGAVQLWLAQDNLRYGSPAEGIRHFDLMFRGDHRATTEMMPALAMIIMSPEGRRHLAPYIRRDNPWILDLVQAAVTRLPRSAPVAQLLIDRRAVAPDVPYIRPIYAQLVGRLFQEKQYELALRLHPQLPGAEKESLHGVSVTADATEGYPPFVWAFADGAEQGAVPIALDDGQTGLEITGAPGTVGIAASKIFTPPAGSAFRWQVIDRTPNLQASANWEMTCLLGPSVKTIIRSNDLLATSVPLKRTHELRVPDGCRLVRLDMRVAGGIGRNPSLFSIGKLSLAGGRAPGKAR
ncbi:hypothetical protein E5675_10090 [Sphingopyxis sp. PAMC25046]|uniref:hypothetical protein n=1 Tax=Sphingopyxis sp. PAMC25046 TaxID=2565556 RepID=UPI00109DA5C7|nr:hypothetical protein [Sphingopyxis sp. PAMC25046]QCB54747.1 hypothetical protein E5675_10090 [Sphingopyxis sp. PAMC25046]